MINEGVMRVVVVILLAAAFVLGTENRASSHDPSSPSVAKKAPRRQVHLPIEDFSLTDQTGKPFRFRALRGKVVVLSFIYTTCPDVCPLITSSMRLVQKNLRKTERDSAFFLSITIDPEVDSAQVLRAYAKRYKVDFSNWSFLTGDMEALVPIWKSFGVKVERKARGLVDHTSLTALIDGKGIMRFAYHGTSPDHKIILRDIHSLLAPR